MENPHPTTQTTTEPDSPNSSQATPALSVAERRAFMRLTLEERRHILAQQAEEMLAHYRHNPQWQELETGDLIDY